MSDGQTGYQNYEGHTEGLLVGKLLYFFAILDLVYEDLCWLKAWNEVLFNHQGRVSGNISGDFLFAFLVNKASKTADINVVSI